MPKRTQPLAEVFGFPIDNFSGEADRHRAKKLCPFNNKVPNCTKDKANDPLGVCSVYEGDQLAITCPVRFRERWIIADDGSEFFFPSNTKWTSLTEVKLKDKYGKSAGNIDLVLVSYDDKGKVTDFGALEVQAVYISGNIRKPFEYYMQDPKSHSAMNWKNQQYWPGPDYLSSSRKRLAPQLIFKGGILHSWRKKTAVALDAPSFENFPKLKEVPRAEADIAWLVYEPTPNARSAGSPRLECRNVVYTERPEAPDTLALAEPESLDDFLTRIEYEMEGFAVE